MRTAVGAAAMVAAAVGYAIAAAATEPFSAAANVLTAVPIAAVTVLAVARWPLHAGAGSDEAPSPEQREGRSPPHPWRAWVVLALIIVGFELVEYLAPGSRRAHPTLSSMADAVDRSRALKAIIFFAWLCLGAGIVRAGTPNPPQDASGA